jgi:hypothetical protein
MFGLSYAWGSEKITQQIDLEPGDEINPTDPGSEVDLKYTRLTFILGFSVDI